MTTDGSLLRQTPQQAEDRLFSAPDANLTDLFIAYPQTSSPLLQLCQAVMQADDCLKVSDRYLLAAYVAGLSGCQYCVIVQQSAAVLSGIDEELLASLMRDLDTAPLQERLKPIFNFARKLTLFPATVGSEDTQAIFNAGWPKRAVHDASYITGLFSMLSRICPGMNMTAPKEAPEVGRLLFAGGYTAIAQAHGLSFRERETRLESASLARNAEESALVPGQRVVLNDATKPVHTGKKATVLEYVPQTANWRVELDNAIVLRVSSDACIPDTSDEPDSDSGYYQSEATMEHSASSGNKAGINVPLPFKGPMSREELAASRFQRVQERMAREFAASPIFQSVRIETEDKTETVYFRVNTRWDKRRKARFAKTYTRLYKDNHRKLRVLIYDRDDQKSVGDSSQTHYPDPMEGMYVDL
ncbi:hypothetical protein DIPPA_08732 [Diplonema papillatum]|nr:hypothetical protein DIPPA_08732 [Diplonema papillatum]